MKQVTQATYTSMIMRTFPMPRYEFRHLVNSCCYTLANGLIHENRSGGGHIERIGKAQHRDAHTKFSTIHPFRG